MAMKTYIVSIGSREHYVNAERINSTEFGLEFTDDEYNRVAFFKEYDFFIQEISSDAIA